MSRNIKVQNQSSVPEGYNLDDVEDEVLSNDTRHLDSYVICMDREGIINPTRTRIEKDFFLKYSVRKF